MKKCYNGTIHRGLSQNSLLGLKTTVCALYINFSKTPSPLLQYHEMKNILSPEIFFKFFSTFLDLLAPLSLKPQFL